jgi:hypothetical protein
MFIRGVLEGQNATSVASKLCLKGVLATIPDLSHRDRVRKDGQVLERGTRNGDVLVLAAAVYVFIVSCDAEYRIVLLNEGVC